MCVCIYLGSVSRVGKFDGQSLELWRLGGMQPSENSISYSGGGGRLGGHWSLRGETAIGCHSNTGMILS